MLFENRFAALKRAATAERRRRARAFNPEVPPEQIYGDLPYFDLTVLRGLERQADHAFARIIFDLILGGLLVLVAAFAVAFLVLVRHSPPAQPGWF